jgi:hypothetical protein
MTDLEAAIALLQRNGVNIPAAPKSQQHVERVAEPERRKAFRFDAGRYVISGDNLNDMLSVSRHLYQIGDTQAAKLYALIRKAERA